MSESIQDRLIRHEGFRSTIYKDSLGFPTIGIGHCLTKDECDNYPNGISYEDAINLLESDICNVKSNCAKEFPWILGLDDCRQSIIYEMAFQLGVGGVSKFHNMIAAIRQQDWATAAKEMLNSQWHQQTPSRVEELAELMLNGYNNET